MINFFKLACKQHTTSDKFGIGDDPNQHAFIDDIDDFPWIAIVYNEKKKNIQFNAIDNCIEILRENGEEEKSCDGMLTYENNIDFIELKSKRQDWIQEGIEQLKTTIEIFDKNHYLKNYKRKRAFLANKKHPRFKHSHKEKMQKFKTKTGVRLIIENKILI